MEKNRHKYVTVAYSLFSDNAEGVHELIEQTNEQHPLQFISGFGTMLEAFEAQIVPLNEGDKFDFTLAVDEAYGPYVAEHVIELDKQVFCIDGRFDKDNIYPGNVIPLTNADGMRFDGVIVEVKDNTVVVDLNHFLAGRALHFTGHVVQSRPATDAEIQGYLNMLSGEGCGCCGEGGGCEGGCGGHHHGEGEGCCGGHHHGEGEGCCGGHCH
ncbi:MAG: FKBP-type peptidyl-prolyl cis-trans isomerase [Bacteroidaceae bacterium]|nr:FKBP-type peptidyl-prolyl cis-trans isomerase [Bacteroidaceae bacterium]